MNKIRVSFLLMAVLLCFSTAGNAFASDDCGDMHGGRACCIHEPCLVQPNTTGSTDQAKTGDSLSGNEGTATDGFFTAVWRVLDYVL